MDFNMKLPFVNLILCRLNQPLQAQYVKNNIGSIKLSK